MKDEARRAYGMLARLFLGVGAVFVVLALLERSGVVDVFHGDPLGVAVLVLIIGGLLEWTVRTAPPPPDEGAPDEGAPDGSGPDTPDDDEGPGA